MLRFLNDPRLNKRQQSARLCKVFCPACGYTMRVTRRWLAIGIPSCPAPACGKGTMTVHWPPEPERPPNPLNTAMEAEGGILPLSPSLLARSIPEFARERDALKALQRTGLIAADLTAAGAGTCLGISEPLLLVRFRWKGHKGLPAKAILRADIGDPAKALRAFLDSRGLALTDILSIERRPS